MLELRPKQQPRSHKPGLLNGRLGTFKVGRCKETRQPFANPSPTLCRPFPNLSRTLCQAFLPTPPKAPLSVDCSSPVCVPLCPEPWLLGPHGLNGTRSRVIRQSLRRCGAYFWEHRTRWTTLDGGDGISQATDIASAWLARAREHLPEPLKGSLIQKATPSHP